MIVSIDVGIKNLALCALDNDTIVLWKVVNVGYNKDICSAIIAEFDEFYEKIKGATVLIEKQMTRKMCVVEAYIEMYFRMKGFEKVIIYNASCKLSGTGKENSGKGKGKYFARKKASIDLCKEWLEKNPQLDWVNAIWKATAKKDDLADTLCMNLSYIKYPIESTTSVVHTSEVRARKPTLRQEGMGKYSKSNIKYLLQNITKFENGMPVITKKIEKSMLKFWKTLELCVKDLKLPLQK